MRYNYYCESETATSVSVSYGSTTGSGYLSLGERKGYSGSCSSDKFRQVMEQVALDLGMLEALSSQEEKDARAEMAAKYCADKIDDYAFPRWTPA